MKVEEEEEQLVTCCQGANGRKSTRNTLLCFHLLVPEDLGLIGKSFFSRCFKQTIHPDNNEVITTPAPKQESLNKTHRSYLLLALGPFLLLLLLIVAVVETEDVCFGTLTQTFWPDAKQLCTSAALCTQSPAAPGAPAAPASPGAVLQKTGS
ncbi:Hypothetical predicted protein, partial [Scomber scombrus]